MARTETKTWVLIGVAVVVIAGIVWYAASRPSTPTQQPGAPGQPSVVVPTFAPKGQVISGFPQSLILDQNAAISGSYSMNYSPTVNQYTAEWSSSSSMLDLYTAYKQYLPAHGWTIINDIASSPNIRGIAAQGTSSNVSVSIIAQSTGSEISVTYVAK